MNVTDVPAQTVSSDAIIETLTGLLGLTIIVMVFDVAGLFVTHTVSEDVKSQVTWSPVPGT